MHPSTSPGTGRDARHPKPLSLTLMNTKPHTVYTPYLESLNLKLSSLETPFSWKPLLPQREAAWAGGGAQYPNPCTFNPSPQIMYPLPYDPPPPHLP